MKTSECWMEKAELNDSIAEMVLPAQLDEKGKDMLVRHSDSAPLTAVAIRRGLQSGELSIEAVLAHFLHRIEEHEGAVQAWREFDPALARANALRQWQAHPRGLLGGVPLAVKDIIATRDYPTRYGSELYREGVRGGDADCVARLRAAGAAVFGKTVTTEFAYFSPGPTANPHDPRRTPGGSSSGSAAAVAAGMVPLALGSQTAGSLIRPAAYCGVFALKPGFGLHSLAGIKPMAPSLDTLGWLANNADDLELMRAALLGIAYEPLPRLDTGGLRLGVCRSHEWTQMEPAGAAAFEAAVSRIAAAAMVSERPLPDELADLSAAQKTVQAYEAARSFATDWEQGRALMSPSLRALIEAGQACAEVDYRAALNLGCCGAAAFEGIAEDVDALLVPAAPGEAPLGLAATGDPVFSRVWTLLGLPCVNVPGQRGPQGMPLGMQLVGRQGSERRLLAIARHLQPLLAELA